MKGQISIIASGDELVNGIKLNTNSQFISRQLNEHFVSLGVHMTCGDSKISLVQAMDWLTLQGSSVIVTGGLGPTDDDKTREAIAELSNLPLEYHEVIANEVNTYLKSKDIELSNRHSKQFYFPKNAVIFKNDRGSAWGFAVLVNERSWLYALPGPPRENKPMFNGQVLGHCLEHHPTIPVYILKWLVHKTSEEHLLSLLESVLTDHKIKLHTCVHDNRTCDVYFNLQQSQWDKSDIEMICRDCSNVLNQHNIHFEEKHVIG